MGTCDSSEQRTWDAEVDYVLERILEHHIAKLEISLRSIDYHAFLPQILEVIKEDVPS